MAWNDKDKANYFSEELLESENNRRVESVANKVSTLKHIALDLRSEVKDQNTMMNDSGGLFENAAMMLSSSFKKVQGMRRTRGQNCKYMLYFALIAVVFLLVMYLLMDKVVSR